jgi:hypothetical protein
LGVLIRSVKVWELAERTFVESAANDRLPLPIFVDECVAAKVFIGL